MATSQQKPVQTGKVAEKENAQSASKEGEKNMATSTAMPAQTVPVVIPPIIDTTAIKQPQTVLNLDTGADDKISVEYTKFSLNDKSTATDAEKLKVAAELVQPPANQIDALLKYATNASYTAGKNAALAKGNYLTSELRRKITNLLADLPQFAELKSSDIADRWLAGYRAKSPKALIWLDRAKQLLAQEDIDF